MKILQKEIILKARRRGFHLVTDEIINNVPEITEINTGIAFLHLKHTSASLSMNENADPDVRSDLEEIFNQIVPERQPYYIHTLEGPDDMPAHAKSAIIGQSLSVPISSGRFNLGTWQGIYLCEHRNHGGERRIVITILAEG